MCGGGDILVMVEWVVTDLLVSRMSAYGGDSVDMSMITVMVILILVMVLVMIMCTGDCRCWWW